MHFSSQFFIFGVEIRKMTKKTNLKILMVGTTTLLMGLNVFVSPLQAATGQSASDAAAHQSKAVLDAAAGSSNSNDGASNKNNCVQPTSAPLSDSGQQSDQNQVGSQSQPKTPVQPETPTFSEPKSKTPFPDSETVTPSKPKNNVKSLFKAQAKKHVVTKNVVKKTAVNKKKPVTQAPKIEVKHNKVNTAKAVTVATPKSKVERGSVEKVSVKKSAPKAAALPQTGQKQNQSVLIGIALSAVALIVGFFGRAKKN